MIWCACLKQIMKRVSCWPYHQLYLICHTSLLPVWFPCRHLRRKHLMNGGFPLIQDYGCRKYPLRKATGRHEKVAHQCLGTHQRCQGHRGGHHLASPEPFQGWCNLQNNEYQQLSLTLFHAHDRDERLEKGAATCENAHFYDFLGVGELQQQLEDGNAVWRTDHYTPFVFQGGLQCTDCQTGGSGAQSATVFVALRA